MYFCMQQQQLKSKSYGKVQVRGQVSIGTTA